MAFSAWKSVLPIWKLFICLVGVNESGSAKLVESAHELSSSPVKSVRRQALISGHIRI